jgi:hypothetical protein
MRRPHDDRPVRGVKARRALRRGTMVAFHKELRVSLTIADEVTFRNKIPTDGSPSASRLDKELSWLSATMTLQVLFGRFGLTDLEKSIDAYYSIME